VDGKQRALLYPHRARHDTNQAPLNLRTLWRYINQFLTFKHVTLTVKTQSSSRCFVVFRSAPLIWYHVCSIKSPCSPASAVCGLSVAGVHAWSSRKYVDQRINSFVECRCTRAHVAVTQLWIFSAAWFEVCTWMYTFHEDNSFTFTYMSYRT